MKQEKFDKHQNAYVGIMNKIAQVNKSSCRLAAAHSVN